MENYQIIKEVVKKGNQTYNVQIQNLEGDVIYEYFQKSSGKNQLFEQVKPDGELHVWYFGGKSYYDELFVNLTTGEAYKTETSHSDVTLGPNWMWTSLKINSTGTLAAVEGCVWACPYQIKFYDISDIENNGWRNEIKVQFSLNSEDYNGIEFNELPQQDSYCCIICEDYPPHSYFNEDDNFVMKHYVSYDHNLDIYCDDFSNKFHLINYEPKPNLEDVEFRVWDEAVYQLIDGVMVEISREIHPDFIRYKINCKINEMADKFLHENDEYYLDLKQWAKSKSYRFCKSMSYHWNNDNAQVKKCIHMNFGVYDKNSKRMTISWIYSIINPILDPEGDIEVKYNDEIFNFPRTLPIPELILELESLIS